MLAVDAGPVARGDGAARVLERLVRVEREVSTPTTGGAP